MCKHQVATQLSLVRAYANLDVANLEPCAQSKGLLFDVDGNWRKNPVSLHGGVQFRRWRGQPGQHCRNVVDVGGDRDSVAPVFGHVIHDLGASHGRDGTSALFLEAEPTCYVDNIVSNYHSWHRQLPLAALCEMRRRKTFPSTTVRRPGNVDAVNPRLD